MRSFKCFNHVAYCTGMIRELCVMTVIRDVEPVHSDRVESLDTVKYECRSKRNRAEPEFVERPLKAGIIRRNSRFNQLSSRRFGLGGKGSTETAAEARTFGNQVDARE